MIENNAPRAILYSFRRCPYAMRARMALLVAGSAVELREVVLRAKPDAMLEASPKGTVPVLVLPDGRVIDESLDVMHWALAQVDPERWLERHDAGLIAVQDGAFKHHLDRYKYPDRHGEDPLAHRAAGLAMLADLEARLAERAFLSGDTCGLTDMAIFPFIRQFAATDAPWWADQPLPLLQIWLDGLTGSSLFTQAMERHAAWQSGDAPVLLRRTSTHVSPLAQ